MAQLSSLYDDVDSQPVDDPTTQPVVTPTTEPHPVIDPFAPKATTATTTGGGHGNGGGGGTGLSGRPTFNFPSAPVFTPVNFALPTFEEAMNEPGYRFAAQAGSDAIEHASAAKGVLRTSGTFKDLAQWNQDLAAQQYNNVANRAFASYNAREQAAKDAFAPQLAQYGYRSQAEIQAGLAAFEREWQQYALANQYHPPNIPPPPNPPEATAFS